MRTTINIDDQLFEAAKRAALERRTTLKKVIEDALRIALLGGSTMTQERPFKLVAFSGDGTLPGVDLNKTSSLLEMDDIARFGKGESS